jgi:hypothetical protein
MVAMAEVVVLVLLGSYASGSSVGVRCIEIVVGTAAVCRVSSRAPSRPFTANGRTYRRRDRSCRDDDSVPSPSRHWWSRSKQSRSNHGLPHARG